MNRNRMKAGLALWMAALMGVAVAGAWADEAAEPAGGGTAPADVEKPDDVNDDGVPAPDPVRSEALATQYGVEQARVDQLRASGMGWGEIDKALAISARMVTDSTVGLTMTAALDDVMALRAAGMGWGEISKQKGYKLGDVVSEGKKGGKGGTGDVPTDDVSGERMKHERHGKPETVGKPDRVGKPDNTGRPAEAGKPDKTPKMEKPEKPEKPVKMEKAERNSGNGRGSAK